MRKKEPEQYKWKRYTICLNIQHEYILGPHKTWCNHECKQWYAMMVSEKLGVNWVSEWYCQDDSEVTRTSIPKRTSFLWRLLVEVSETRSKKELPSGNDYFLSWFVNRGLHVYRAQQIEGRQRWDYSSFSGGQQFEPPPPHSWVCFW